MVKKTFLLISLFFVLIFNVYSKQYPLINNIQGRQNIISLAGKWQIIIDPYERGSYDYHSKPLKNGFRTGSSLFSDFNKLYVPGDWNTQKDELLYYEGTIWYHTQFNYEKDELNRVFLHFGAINYEAEVYLNGEELGKHVGGYTPFNFEVTQILKKGINNLVIKVSNNRSQDGVPALMFDWWNFGGITRPVTLIETPVTFIRDYLIYIDKNNKQKIKGWVKLDGEDNQLPLSIEIPELKVNEEVKTDQNGYGYFEINTEPEFWTPENPKLYEINLITKKDIITEKIGFRTIETQGNKILLNGRELFLRGINMHAQLNGRSVCSKEEAAHILGWAKELGCNFIRLSHYPHSEETIRMAEEMGILVWEEIPVYWAIQWDNNETYLNAESQLEAIICRDKNRANVIIWSMANETPEGELRYNFLTRLANKARELDDQRLISAALLPKEIEPNRWTINDNFTDIVDVIGFNQYIGWFNGTPEKCDETEWVMNIEKPYLMTEFGSSSPYNSHGDSTERYTEEFQEYHYIKTIEMIKRMTNLSGVCPWNLTEHRSPRLISPNIEDGFSRAGLVSSEGQRKKAFYVLKNYYKESDNW